MGHAVILGALAVISAAAYVGPRAIVDNPVHAGIGIALLVGLAMLGAHGAGRVRKLKARIDLVIRRHAATLARKRSQLVYVDDYGVLRDASWQDEKRYFLDNLVLPGLSERERTLFGDRALEPVVLEMIEAAALAQGYQPTADTLDPFEYERYCARQLEEAGWTARVTKAAGDQGADVVAEKDGRRLVIQCKLYSKPVGNKAVQEAFAAKGFEQADGAAVVTNAGYTPAARRLAASNRVLLLHHDDLATLDTADLARGALSRKGAGRAEDAPAPGRATRVG